MPAEARNHEPRLALDGGADGLQVQRRLVAGACRWLAPSGHLVVETSARQAPASVAAAEAAGLTARAVTSEDLDATVVVAAVGAAPGTRARS
jgi:release factor glutamine methyltransferase